MQVEDGVDAEPRDGFNRSVVVAAKAVVVRPAERARDDENHQQDTGGNEPLRESWTGRG